MPKISLVDAYDNRDVIVQIMNLKDGQDAVTALLDGKVDKIEGKGLSTNDYTNEDKTKLAGLANATIESVSKNGTLIPIVDKNVNITVPVAINELTEDATHRTVTDTEKGTWDGKQDPITSGTNINVAGNVINHAPSGIVAGTVGSTTAVPVLTLDAQGHVTVKSTATIYPPTTAGTNGNIWQSNGSDQGVWQTPDTAPTASSVKMCTSGGIKTYIDNLASGKLDKVQAIGDAGKFMKVGADGTLAPASVPGGVELSDATPQDLGTAGAGTNGYASRADHVHKKPTASEIGALPANAPITPGIGTKITVDTNGLVTGIDTLIASDIPIIAESQVNGLITDLAGKQPTITAGTNLIFSGTTLNHNVSGVTAGTAGSATSVPVLTIDANGHITSRSSATIYPPTTAGTAGQIWISDGAATGAWDTLDTTPAPGSTHGITSGAVYTATNNKANAPTTYSSGTLNVNGTWSSSTSRTFGPAQRPSTTRPTFVTLIFSKQNATVAIGSTSSPTTLVFNNADTYNGDGYCACSFMLPVGYYFAYAYDGTGTVPYTYQTM